MLVSTATEQYTVATVCKLTVPRQFLTLLKQSHHDHFASALDCVTSRVASVSCSAILTELNSHAVSRCDYALRVYNL